jgi:hypothetical protein
MGGSVSIGLLSKIPNRCDNDNDEALVSFSGQKVITTVTARRSSNTKKFHNGEDIDEFILMVFSRGNALKNISSILAYKQSRFHFLSYVQNQDASLYATFCRVSRCRDLRTQALFSRFKS